MAITANFRPAQMGQFQTGYTPFPFEDIAPIAMRMQQEYTAGVGEAGELASSVGGFTIAKADAGKGEQKMTEAKEKVRGVLQKTPDARSPEFHMNLTKVESDIKNDPFWKITAANAAMEQKWAKVLADPNLTPADQLDMQLKFNRYEKLGADYGKLEEPISPKREDWGARLEQMGRGFIQEGEKAIIEADGTIIVSDKWRGVLPKEVAYQYGYNYDNGKLTLAAIPEQFSKSIEGRSMYRDAQYNAYASTEPTTVEQEYKNLYERATRPMVSKYSGLTTSLDIQGMPGSSTTSTKNPAGTLSFSGNTITVPDSPTSAKQIDSLNMADTTQLDILSGQLSDVSPDSNRARYIKQQINDINSDIEERNSLLTASRNEVEYEKNHNKVVISAFSAATLTDEMYELFTDTTIDASGVFEGVKDYNNDGKVTIDDARQALHNYDFYASNVVGPDDNEFGGALADVNPTRFEDGMRMKELFKENGYLKEAKKARKKVKKLDDELNKVLKNKAGTITYTDSPFTGVSKESKEQLGEIYDAGEQWRVEDSEGNVLEEGKKPGKLEFSTFTKGYIPHVGYVFSAKDEDGETYKVSSESIEGVGQVLGQALMNKNKIGSANWEDGFRMVYPGYADDVDRLVTGGGARTLYDPNTADPIATVEKISNEYIVTYTNDEGKLTTIGGDLELTTRNKVLTLLDAIVAPKQEEE